ncbi:hypothetical protein HPB52_025502 [Rhipicephalus sanguineus]|uniref:Uncharacterized protein n=1 Tax=Rhipicephalus sanguineus TaxID=34632 RepID=A0A9D4TCY6_RHISA|nr:hypothetical protein HPB52_025502 [Rhipicephalus sanguineus]
MAKPSIIAKVEEPSEWLFPLDLNNGYERAAAEAAEKAKAALSSTNPQCDKSAVGHRVSSLKAAALTGEAPLKELDHTDSSDADSGRKRPDSLTRGSPAVSRRRA